MLKKSLSDRKHRDSVYKKVVNEGSQLILVYVVDDLTNEELQRHMIRAFSKEDYEYCQALASEAKNRGITLKIEDE